MQMIETCIFCKMINKNDIIFKTINGKTWRKALNIIVNKLKRFITSKSRGTKGQPMTFVITRLTKKKKSKDVVKGKEWDLIIDARNLVVG